MAKTFLRLEVADLPLVNPDCAGWIRDGIMCAKRVAIILDSILESMFSNDIGRYDPGFCGSLPFFAIGFMFA